MSAIDAHDPRWMDAWTLLGAAPRNGLLAELLSRWTEPHRAYHDVTHLDACLRTFGAAVSGGAADDLDARARPAIEIGLWFHDAIYDPRAKDNEDASAAWARGELVAGGAAEDVAERVARLVLATKHDATPTTPAAALLVDVDLSILGEDEETFAAYEAAVRREYAFVPDEAFRSGRAKILEAFLERQAIYATRWFAERFEARARRNLERSLRALSRATGGAS